MRRLLSPSLIFIFVFIPTLYFFFPITRGPFRSGTDQQIQYLVAQGLIDAFVRVLGEGPVQADTKLAAVALSALENTLKAGNALARRHTVANEYVARMVDAGLPALLQELRGQGKGGEVEEKAAVLLQAMQISHTNPSDAPLEWELSRMSLSGDRPEEPSTAKKIK